MKTDKISSHKTAQHFLSLWENPENFKGRKRNMQKESDRDILNLLADQIRNKQQLIIVYPNRVTGLYLFYNSLGELLIDLFIGLPLVIVKNDILFEVMKKRPNGFIGQSEVKVFYLLLIEMYRFKIHCPERGLHL